MSGPAPLSREGFADAIGADPSVMERLDRYLALLLRWQPRINLVGPGSLVDPWRRHFLDSAQLHPQIPATARSLVDLGSGAGFPGMVLAILGVPGVRLIESDRRKAAFLAEVSRETSTPVAIDTRRIESIADVNADVVTARALAPMARLLGWVRQFAGPETVALLLKGQDVERELTEATMDRRMHQGLPTITLLPSRSDPKGWIVRMEGF